MSEIKKLRLKFKYSCATMARLLKISKAYYWQLENNKRRLTYYMALNISKIFSVMPNDILEWSNNIEN